MRVLVINVVCGFGSTGRIAADAAREHIANGDEVLFAYGRGAVPDDMRNCAVRIGNDADLYIHAAYTRLTDHHGLASVRATESFLRRAEEFSPDLLLLHNIHGYYLNYELLFSWIKARPQMKVRWTLHDEWAFTGHCACYNAVKCSSWKTICRDCPQKGDYPASIADNSEENFLRKKAAFCGVPNLTVITPSQWLAQQVRDSFLSGYGIEVCPNRVDTSVFRPTQSDFRKAHNIGDKFIVLGVAGVWQKCKGLYDLYELSRLLDDSFQVVLVGLTEKQLRQKPDNVLGIMRTHGTKELAQIYSAADVFVNPSTEESFSMTTLEAKSCGTRVIVYGGTACEELVDDSCGMVIEPTVGALYAAVTEIRNRSEKKL